MRSARPTTPPHALTRDAVCGRRHPATPLRPTRHRLRPRPGPSPETWRRHASAAGGDFLHDAADAAPTPDAADSRRRPATAATTPPVAGRTRLHALTTRGRPLAADTRRRHAATLAVALDRLGSSPKAAAGRASNAGGCRAMPPADIDARRPPPPSHGGEHPAITTLSATQADGPTRRHVRRQQPSPQLAAASALCGRRRELPLAWSGRPTPTCHDGGHGGGAALSAAPAAGPTPRHAQRQRLPPLQERRADSSHRSQATPALSHSLLRTDGRPPAPGDAVPAQ